MSKIKQYKIYKKKKPTKMEIQKEKESMFVYYKDVK